MIQLRVSGVRSYVLTVIAAVAVLLGMSVAILSARQVSAYSGAGAGTDDNPYQISTCEQLQEMKDDLTASYILTNDIDCTESQSWNEGLGFEPVGSEFFRFTGWLNGNGKVISDLHIDRPEESYIGIFGYIGSAGSVTDLGNESVFLVGDDHVGGIAGISNGELTRVYTSGEIEGNENVGGIVGFLAAGGSIEDAYSRSDIIANTGWAGGIAGFSSSNFDSIKNTYVTGTIDTAGAHGAIGFINDPSVITASFYDSEATGLGADKCNYNGDTEECVATSTADMMKISTFTAAGWDFADIWYQSDNINDGYPFLRPPHDYTITTGNIDGLNDENVDEVIAHGRAQGMADLENVTDDTYFGIIYGTTNKAEVDSPNDYDSYLDWWENALDAVYPNRSESTDMSPEDLDDIAFSSILEGLSCDVTYYYRAIVETDMMSGNLIAIYYGDQKSFTIPCGNDLNVDNINDETQDYVTVFENVNTSKTVVLEVGEDCTTDIVTVRRENQLEVQDSSYDYANGLIGFTADCGTPGYTMTVRIFFYDVEKGNQVVRKHNPNTQAFFNLTDEHDVINEQTTINGQLVTVVSYTIVDGGELDVDGEENGIIVDPVGLADQVVGVPNTGLVGR